VTLVEITDTYEDVRTDSASIVVHNQTGQALELSGFYITLMDDGDYLGVWSGGDAYVNAYGSTTVQLSGNELGTHQVLTNTSPEVQVTITQFDGAAMMATFRYPEWQYNQFNDIRMSLSGEWYEGSKALPTLTRAPGSTYVFPHTNFEITFE
jgi:hypothetical protein